MHWVHCRDNKAAVSCGEVLLHSAGHVLVMLSAETTAEMAAGHIAAWQRACPQPGLHGQRACPSLACMGRGHAPALPARAASLGSGVYMMAKCLSTPRPCIGLHQGPRACSGLQHTTIHLLNSIDLRQRGPALASPNKGEAAVMRQGYRLH